MSYPQSSPYSAFQQERVPPELRVPGAVIWEFRYPESSALFYNDVRNFVSNIVLMLRIKHILVYDKLQK